jgi:hypothetical protein
MVVFATVEERGSTFDSPSGECVQAGKSSTLVGVSRSSFREEDISWEYVLESALERLLKE